MIENKLKQIIEKAGWPVLKDTKFCELYLKKHIMEQCEQCESYEGCTRYRFLLHTNILLNAHEPKNFHDLLNMKEWSEARIKRAIDPKTTIQELKEDM